MNVMMPSAAPDNLKMLVVDDDDVDRERVRRFLNRSALQVEITEAESGLQALQLLKGSQFDCIVLDNHLGDTTGAELISQIQAEDTAACPIIMVTGAGSESLAVQAMMDGAYDYLPKTNLSVDVLQRSVRRAVEMHRVRCELRQVHASLEQRVDQQAATIRQSEKDLRALVDNAPTAMAYWDRDGRCRFGNLCMGQWFQIPSAQLKGMPLSDVLGPVHYLSVADHAAKALRGEEQTFEQRFVSSDGGPLRWGLWQLRPDIGDDGACLGFYSSLSDITVRRQIQERVEELLRFSDAVIQHSPIGIAVFQADGICTLSNQAFADACGDGLDWKQSSLWPHIESTLREGLPRRVDVPLIPAHGMERQFSCSLARFERDGWPQVLVMARDVTEQLQAYDALVMARDSAESAARAKSAFLANMSHEIRTPMNAIVGFSRLVLEDELPVSARSYIEKMHTSALALMDILDDVLDYSKIEAGYMHLEHTRFVLEETIQRLADLFQARIEQKNLLFIVDLAPDLPRVFLGDPLRLSQVLTNLVGNALKFTEHGHIRLRVQAQPCPDQSGRVELAFSVQDTGIGVSPDKQAGLFEAFIQGDGSITRRFGGTGLGLAISKRLVSLMHGQIGVRSVLGQGSEFWFHVQLDVADEPVLLDSSADVAGQRALVIDANVLSSRALQRQLRSWHVVPHAGIDLPAGLGQLERLKRKGLWVDTLLIDFAQLDATGMSYLAQLIERASEGRTRPLKLILTTTQSERVQAQRLPMVSEPHSVLVKPVLASRLLEALRVKEGAEALVDAARAQDWHSHSNRLRVLAAPLHGARILLAEDNELNQIVAHEFLRRCGMQVTIVDDGVKAVAAVRELGAVGFDAVLMDMHMPVMDGLEATRRIKALPQAADLPIIGMTAAVLPEDRIRCKEAGMVDHIAKPVIPETVIEILLKWVSKQSVKSIQTPVSPQASSDVEFDLEALRARVHGNDSLVWKLLAAFVQQESGAVAVVKQLVSQSDLELARRKAHDLKGSAANLGLMAYSKAASQLQDALRRGEGVDVAVTQFELAHLTCMNTLQVLLLQAGA